MNARPSDPGNFSSKTRLLRALAMIGFCFGSHGALAAVIGLNGAIMKSDEVAKAFEGYNYVMKSDRDGNVESVVVSGENGSGADAEADLLPEGFPMTTLSQVMKLAWADRQNPAADVLEENMQGRRAIEALGTRLPIVAAAHGMTPERFKEILEKDSSAWIDVTGRMYYVESPPSLPKDKAAEAIPSKPLLSAAESLDLAKTFQLHSRPGANRVIYLDFNGQTVTGTAWNASYKLPTITAMAFDLSGDPANFDDAERERIQYIWQRVAEDYAAFDVDVTTEEPAADALDRSGSTDSSYGTRALITTTVFNCGGCGGIAYVGVFDYTSNYKPAWIFYDQLSSGHEKYVAEAISHEVGHNLGLSHDGASDVSYYQGHGTGATSWAPIMGVGYYREVVEWSAGEYPSADNQENDFDIIQSHGAPVRTDDIGNTFATAKTLVGTVRDGVMSVDQAGNIEQRSDADIFVFATTGGEVDFTLAPAARGANLDISAELYNSAGALLLASNPDTDLGTTLSTTLAAGTYYLKIDGTGRAVVDADPGYSDYGSLGQYRVTGSYVQNSGGEIPVQQAPTAVASSSAPTGTATLPISFSSAGSSDDGVITSYLWDFGDGTPASNEPNPLHTFAKAGAYQVTLIVTDNVGLTGSSSVSVTVTPDTRATTLRIDQMNIRLIGTKNAGKAIVDVKITNGNGEIIPKVRVSGRWSGLANGAGTVSVNKNSGLAVFRSRTFKAKKGTIVFTVTGASLKGYTYSADQNTRFMTSMTR